MTLKHLQEFSGVGFHNKYKTRGKTKADRKMGESNNKTSCSFWAQTRGNTSLRGSAALQGSPDIYKVTSAPSGIDTASVFSAT
jgi:hypothetical protein